jgi:hypothetical protein
MASVDNLAGSVVNISMISIQNRMLSSAFKAAEGQPEAQGIIGAALLENGKKAEEAAMQLAKAAMSGLGQNVDRSI